MRRTGRGAYSPPAQERPRRAQGGTPGRQPGQAGRGTVIRYDISRDAARAIEWVRGEACWRGLEAYEADRWAGHGRPPWACWTFAVTLPRDAGWMAHTARFCLDAGTDDTMMSGPHGEPAVTRSLHRLALKLLHDLGLPGRSPSCPQEKAFVEAALAAPQDMATWTAYSEWLQERGGVDAGRGLRMTHWLWGWPRDRGRGRR